MTKLFFLLSGENETLPASEVKAILEAEGYPYKNAEKFDQLLRLEVSLKCAEIVQARAAFTRLTAQEVFICNATNSDIAKAVAKIDFKNYLSKGESFAVRVTRIKNYADNEINTMALEKTLGKIILENAKEAKVNLKHPEKTFVGIVTNEKLAFGLKLTEMTIKTYSERRPRKKPFFHPSAMPSKLARCMVNLAHGKTGALMLDPFCGTGSSLIEGALVGCRVLGVDAQMRMVKGSRKNLKHFRVSVEGLLLADARKLPLNMVDCVVTDPPYGKSASTLKSTTRALVIDVLASSHALINIGQRVCIASPKTLNISRLGVTLGYKHVESHFAYVHRTLTREICVFKKEQNK